MLSISNSTQAAWNRPNTIGYGMVDGVVDDSEACGAIDSFVGAYPLKGRVLDNGGGSEGYNKAHIYSKWDLEMDVIDKYMRPPEHNKRILDLAKKKPYDSSMSMSILNVIDTPEARKEYIEQCKSVLTRTGKAYFKVWAGNGTSKEQYVDGGYQSNKDYTHYVNEIRAVFGARNVHVDHKRKLIVASNTDRNPFV